MLSYRWIISTGIPRTIDIYVKVMNNYNNSYKYTK